MGSRDFQSLLLVARVNILLKYIFYKLINLILILALCLSAAPVYADDLSQIEPGSDYTYGDCSQTDPDALRTEIEQIAHAALTDESSGVDIDAIVARHWATLDMDSTIDSEVARAVADLSNREGYWSRLWSAWSAEQAEEFAITVANDAFGSPTFTAKIDELSVAVATEIAQEIEADFARAASVAFLCMKAFVGEQYSATLFSAFENKVSLEVDQIDVAAANPTNVSIVDVHQKALGGVGVIVVTEISRRIAQKLATKIAQRIAGKIAGRVVGKAGSALIPIAGWVIGLGLIVWDLWEGGKGALPQIQESLQSEEVKTKIRAEITESVRDGLPQEVSIVALEIAVSIIEEWDEFCGRYQSVCIIAAENETFQQILDVTPLDQIDELSTLVNIFVEDIGRSQLNSAVDNGQFEALLTVPPAALEIFRATQSVETTLAWAELADNRLAAVVEFGIYQQKTPADFDPALLAAVTDLADNAAIHNLLALDRNELERLIDVTGANFPSLALKLSTPEMRALVTLAQPASEQDIKDLVEDKKTVKELVEPASSGATPMSAESSTANESPGAPGFGVSVRQFLAETYAFWYAFFQPLWSNSVIAAATMFITVLLLALGVSFILQKRKEK